MYALSRICAVIDLLADRINHMIPSRPFLRRTLPGILMETFRRHHMPIPAEGLDDFVNNVIRSLDGQELPQAESAVPGTDPNAAGADTHPGPQRLSEIRGFPEASDWDDMLPFVMPNHFDDYFYQFLDHHPSIPTSI